MMRRFVLPALAVCACSSGSVWDPPPSIHPSTEPKNPDLADVADAGVDPPADPAPRPDYGTTVSLADAPPPVSGGTLAVSPDGKIAVAADPDRDRIYVIDPVAPALVATIGLLPHDEPGRVVIDGSNRAHVVLRTGGALVTIDLGTLKASRRNVCAAPRGVAWEAAGDRVYVACATGELVTLDAAGGP